MNEENRDPFSTEAAPDEKPATGFAPAVGNVPTTSPMTRLAAKVLDEFRVNAEHRRVSHVDEMLEYAAMSSKMKYSQRQIQILQQQGIDPRNYRPLTAMKVRAAKAMLTDVIRKSGDKPYTLSPTPKPTIPKSAEKKILMTIAQEIDQYFRENGGAIPPEDEQRLTLAVMTRMGDLYDDVRRREDEWARDACERMDRKIHDQLVEGNFIDEFNTLVSYICTYGTALMVGPCPRTVATCTVKESETSAGAVPKYVRDFAVKPVYEAVSPWDCYPAPNARRVTDGTLCIKVRYTSSVLWQYAEAMEGMDAPDGWMPQTVRALLSQYPNGGVRLEMDARDMVRREVERNSLVSNRDCTLEGVRCFSSFRGSDLISFGITRIPDGDKVVFNRYYKTETIVIGGYVVYCRIIDERMPLPVAKATLYESPDSWWGDTIADLVYSAQSLQNNALKNIIQNGALSSNGMFYCQDVQNVVSLDGSPALSIRAGKMFGFKRSMNGNSGAPLGIISVPDTTQMQMNLLKEASRMADDDSGIPQYTIGSSATGGAARTASGFAMQQESVSRVVNMCLCDLGRNIICDVVRKTHVYNLLTDDDISIKGDVEINPSGLMGKILREAESQRRQQVTAMLGQHPVLSKSITVEGFFELIRPELQNIGVNPDKIIPSKERMAIYQSVIDAVNLSQAAQVAQIPPTEEGDVGASPTPEQANVARVEGSPETVAMEQGAPNAGTVAERRGAA